LLCQNTITWRWTPRARNERHVEVASQNEALAGSRKGACSPPNCRDRKKSRKKKRPKQKSGPVQAQGRRQKNAAPGHADQHQNPRPRGKVKPKVLTTFHPATGNAVDAGPAAPARTAACWKNRKRNGTLRRILGELALAIEAAARFPRRWRQHPKVFNRLFVNMVKAGETGRRAGSGLEKPGGIFREKRRKSRARSKPRCFIQIAVLVRGGGHPDFLLMSWWFPSSRRFHPAWCELPPFTVFVLACSDAHPVPYSANAGSDSGSGGFVLLAVQNENWPPDLGQIQTLGASFWIGPAAKWPSPVSRARWAHSSAAASHLAGP